jgi:hypothetical protein
MIAIVGLLIAIGLLCVALILMAYLNFRLVSDLTMKIMSKDAQEYVQIRTATAKPAKPTSAMKEPKSTNPGEIDLSDEDGFDRLMEATDGK